MDSRASRLAEALGPLHSRVQKMYVDTIKENFFAPKFVVFSAKDFETLVDAYGYEPAKFMGLTIINETGVA